MSYKVTAPLVVIANDDRTSGDWYGYTDAVVPSGWNDDRVKQLVEEGFLAEVDDGDDGPPAKGAKLEVWQNWARSQGATDEDLDGVTKADLIAAYGEQD